MKKRFTYGLLLLGLGFNLFVGTQIYLSTAHGADREDPYDSIKLFTRVLEMVRKDYVDGEKLSYQTLVYGALRGMLNTLDPHSEFMEPRKFDDLKHDTEGEFGGLGVIISLKDNYLTVVTPMDDTPGARAGILPGDRIVKIDGKNTEKLTLPDGVQRLRGEKGTSVKLTIFRPATGETKDYELTRDVIKVPSTKDINGKQEYPLSANKVGHISLSGFGEKTGDELERALKTLEGQGAESLIIDLRDNPGGLLDQAVAVCEKFLPRGQLIVSTEGRASSQRHEYPASGRNQHPHLPIVLLVNGGSASASEIVAGCLQDLKRAVVLGEQTFGKGSVQSILPMPDGSALRLTTAKYYTPSHKVIHEKGITPDIIVPMSQDEERDLALKRSPYGLDSLDERDQDRVRNARDVQLERAMDLLKGISLYSKRAGISDRAMRKAGEKMAAAK